MSGDDNGDQEVLDTLREMRTDMRAQRTESNENFTAIRQQIDGVTQRMDDHARDNSRDFGEVRRDVTSVRQDLARVTERVAKVESASGGFPPEAGTSGTGRHRVLRDGDMVIPTPALGVPMSIEIGRKARDSGTPAAITWIGRMVGRVAKSTAGKIAVPTGALLAGFLIKHVLTPVETRLVEVPIAAAATAPPVVPAASVVTPVATSVAASVAVPALDGGAPNAATVRAPGGLAPSHPR